MYTHIHTCCKRSRPWAAEDNPPASQVIYHGEGGITHQFPDGRVTLWTILYYLLVLILILILQFVLYIYIYIYIYICFTYTLLT